MTSINSFLINDYQSSVIKFATVTKSRIPMLVFIHESATFSLICKDL